MMRAFAIVAAAALFAQPAFACRVGGATILFDTAPANPPADLTLAHGRFRSAGPLEIAANGKTASARIGVYTEIGTIELDSAETVRVFAVLHSCLSEIWRFHQIEGNYYMVGKLQGEPGQRIFFAADLFEAGHVPGGLWTWRKPD